MSPESPQKEDAIFATNLKKSFGHFDALRGIDLKLKRGSFLTLFGPNGAGKTTLIRILSSLSRPSSGKAFVAGFDISDQDPEMRQQIGVISHASFLYAELSALENLIHYGKLYSLPKPEEKAQHAIDEADLKLRMHDPVRTFSRGMVQRLAIARATLHDPSILFLDEPYTGLDPQASRRLNQQLEKLRTENRTLMMTIHDFSQGLELCDQVAIQVRGRLILHKPKNEIDTEHFEEEYLDCVQKAS